MAETETKRHPLAIAWDDWLASDEGQHARNIDTLARYTDRYLENRLKRAFDAGAKAAMTSPADFEQLTRLREIAKGALQFRIEMNGPCEHEEYMVKLCTQCEIREALAHSRTGE